MDVGLIPRKKAIGEETNVSPLKYKLTLSASLYRSCGREILASGIKHTSKLPGTTSWWTMTWEWWRDWLETASGKRRDKVSSNQMGSISRGSPPRPEVTAVGSPGISRCPPLPPNKDTLLLEILLGYTRRELNFNILILDHFPWEFSSTNFSRDLISLFYIVKFHYFSNYHPC